MEGPQHAYIKERVSLNIVRLKKGGETFEIVLTDPDLALDYRKTGKGDITEMLKAENVFKDAKKGELASEDLMKKWLGTEDVLAAADIIIKEGEFHLTADQKRMMSEEKKKKIINFIHTNAIDPKTRLPHPLTRIELAMDQAKVHVDAFQSVQEQVKVISEKLREILPLSFERIHLKVRVDGQYAGHAYGVVKGKYNVVNEKWNNDGSVDFEIDEVAGAKIDIIDVLNKVTNGTVEIVEEKQNG
jgi:ribosome maturation protein SDO1